MFEPLNVILGCEESGAVGEQFVKLGHNVLTCDLLPTRSKIVNHFQGDIFDALRTRKRWDIGIFFPPCTFLCSSGLHWVKRGRIEADGRPRIEHQKEALSFVSRLLDLDIDRLALENPIGCIPTKLGRPYSQIIQPYEFGDDASKSTCLWLKNLPLLVPTRYVEPRLVCDHCRHVFKYGQHKCPKCRSEKFKPRWANQTDSGQNKLGPSDDRDLIRSTTYPGIATAMACQWGW